MEDTATQVAALRVDVATLQAEIKSTWRRIDEQKQLTATVQDLALSVRDLAHAQRSNSELLTTLQKDVEELKAKPAKRWDTVVTQIITLIIAAVAGGVVSKLFG